MSAAEKLDEKQAEIVSCVDKHIVVSAPAGSGKTRVLASKYADLVKTYSASEIVLCSFTNKATNELKERLTVKNIDFDKSNIVTFHGLCKSKILVPAGHEFFKSEIEKPWNQVSPNTADEDKLILESIKMYRDAHPEVRCKIDEATAKRAITFLSGNLGRFQRLKAIDSLHSRGIAEADVYADIYRIHDNLKKDKGVYELNDWMKQALYVLRENKNNIHEKILKDVKYIFVDEVQDLSKVQTEIIEELKIIGVGVLCVGDTQQSIYSFRGAYPSYFEGLINSSDWTHISLDTNYRSNKEICVGAQNLFGSTSVNFKSDKGLGGELVSMPFILTHFKLWVEEAVEADKSVGILLRTNKLCQLITEYFDSQKIKYTSKGSKNNKKNHTLYPLFIWLNLLINDDLEFFVECLRSPYRYTTGEEHSKLNSIISKNKDLDLKGIFKIIKEDKSLYKKVLSFKQDIAMLKEELEDCESLHDFVPILGNFSFDDVKTPVTLFEFCENYKNERMNWKPKGRIESDEELTDFNLINIEELAEEMLSKVEITDDFSSALAEFENNFTSSKDESSKIEVLTVHASKGKEFDEVYLPFFDQEIIPFKFALDRGEEGIEEEKRLAYVAVTRAKEKCYLAYNQEPSQFIESIFKQKK